MKNSKIWIFLKGLIAENPVLVLVLGTLGALIGVAVWATV